MEDNPATLPRELRRARDLLCLLQHVNVDSGGWACLPWLLGLWACLPWLLDLFGMIE